MTKKDTNVDQDDTMNNSIVLVFSSANNTKLFICNFYLYFLNYNLFVHKYEAIIDKLTVILELFQFYNYFTLKLISKSEDFSPNHN